MSRIFTVIAQLGLFLFAARVLTPAEFGIFAIFSTLALMLGVIGSAGWREFILSTQDENTGVNQAITASFLSGYVMTMAGVASAAVAVLAFNNNEVALLMLLLSASILPAPPERAISALFIRDGRMGVLAATVIIAESLGLAVGVWALLQGLGIYGLALARVVMQLARLLGAAFCSRWNLRLIVSSKHNRDLNDMSRSILFVRLVDFLSFNASIFIVGGFLGAANAGFFRAAQRVVSAFHEMLYEPFQAIAWMVFRNAAKGKVTSRETQEALAQESLIFFPLLLFCIAPVFVGMAMVAEDLVVFMLGEAWLPSAQVIVILAISALVRIPSVANEPLLSIAGKIRALPRVMTLNMILTIIALLIFTQFGLIAAALARLGSSVIFFVLSLWVQNRHVGTSWWSASRRAAPVFSGLIALVTAVFIAGKFLEPLSLSLLTVLSIQVVVGALAYLITIFVVRPSFLRTTLWL